MDLIKQAASHPHVERHIRFQFLFANGVGAALMFIDGRVQGAPCPNVVLVDLNFEDSADVVAELAIRATGLPVVVLHDGKTTIPLGLTADIITMWPSDFGSCIALLKEIAVQSIGAQLPISARKDRQSIVSQFSADQWDAWRCYCIAIHKYLRGRHFGQDQRLGDHVAEDHVQDVLLSFVQAMELGNVQAGMERAYLRTCVYNRMIDAVRTRQETTLEEERLTEETPLRSRFSDREDLHAVHQTLQGVTRLLAEQEDFLLRAYLAGGFDYEKKDHRRMVEHALLINGGHQRQLWKRIRAQAEAASPKQIATVESDCVRSHEQVDDALTWAMQSEVWVLASSREGAVKLADLGRRVCRWEEVLEEGADCSRMAYERELRFMRRLWQELGRPLDDLPTTSGGTGNILRERADYYLRNCYVIVARLFGVGKTDRIVLWRPTDAEAGLSHIARHLARFPFFRGAVAETATIAAIEARVSSASISFFTCLPSHVIATGDFRDPKWLHDAICNELGATDDLSEMDAQRVERVYQEVSDVLLFQFREFAMDLCDAISEELLIASQLWLLLGEPSLAALSEMLRARMFVLLAQPEAALERCLDAWTNLASTGDEKMKSWCARVINELYEFAEIDRPRFAHSCNEPRRYFYANQIGQIEAMADATYVQEVKQWMDRNMGL